MPFFHALSATHLVALFTVFSCFSIGALANDAITGVWRTEGYGYILKIVGEEATLYETTSISCLESVLELGSFEKSDGMPLIGSFPAQVPGFIDARMEVRQGKTANSILLRRSDTVTQMTAYRLDSLPALCKSDTVPSNSSSLQLFKQTFLEHYAFLNRVEQDAIQALEKREVGEITDQKLFQKLLGIARSIGDQHAAIIAPSIDSYYFGDEQLGDAVNNELKAAFDNLISEEYAFSGLQSYAKGMITFGALKAGPAYLRVDGFSGYDAEDNIEASSRVLYESMRDILQKTQAINGLIIDLRANRGGSDELALSLASMLTKEKYIAYRKQAVSHIGGANLVWDVGFMHEVLPAPEMRYTGKIVILTSRHTISAAETFLMAMMNRQPEVTRVGERTAGAFSDRLPRRLPNGWLFSLSNERYLDKNGLSYEGVGLEPHVKVPSFSETDLSVGRDAALDMAIRALKIGEN